MMIFDRLDISSAAARRSSSMHVTSLSFLSLLSWRTLLDQFDVVCSSPSTTSSSSHPTTRRQSSESMRCSKKHQLHQACCYLSMKIKFIFALIEWIDVVRRWLMILMLAQDDDERPSHRWLLDHVEWEQRWMNDEQKREEEEQHVMNDVWIRSFDLNQKWSKFDE